MEIFIKVCVLAMLVGAAVWDVRTGRIPNLYNGIWMLSGIIISFFSGGIHGIIYGSLGLMIPVAGLMLLFFSRVLGGGDIKLLGAVGSFLWLDVIDVIIYSFLLCGIYGGGLMLVRLINGVARGSLTGGLINELTNNRQFTRVAFSIFVMAGYGVYLLRGGVELGI